MKGLCIVLCLSLGALAYAAEIVPDDQPMPTLPPVGLLTPELPRPSAPNAQGDEQWLRRLEQETRRLEARISELLARYQGSRPAGTMADLPQVLQARQLRDAAWKELQEILAASNEQKKIGDVLDAPARNQSNDPQQRRLEAQNQLAIARVLYQLATTSGEPSHIEEGALALSKVSEDDLPVEERPQLVYYRFALALEHARRAPVEAQPAAWSDVRRYRDDLTRRFSSSYLARASDSLLAAGEMEQVARSGVALP